MQQEKPISTVISTTCVGLSDVEEEKPVNKAVLFVHAVQLCPGFLPASALAGRNQSHRLFHKRIVRKDGYNVIAAGE